MEMPRSTFHYKSNSKRKREEPELLKRIESITEEFPRYGYRRITKQLQRDGVKIKDNRVLRIMRENNLLSKKKRKWIKVTDSHHSFEIYPNLIKDIIITGINQVWVADITYISLQREYIYLAAILDYFSYCISGTLDTSLTLNALLMAIERSKPVREVIHHSERGVQYVFQEYTDVLKKNGFRISMVAKGNPFFFGLHPSRGVRSFGGKEMSVHSKGMCIVKWVHLKLYGRRIRVGGGMAANSSSAPTKMEGIRTISNMNELGEMPDKNKK